MKGLMGVWDVIKSFKQILLGSTTCNEGDNTPDGVNNNNNEGDTIPDTENPETFDTQDLHAKSCVPICSRKSVTFLKPDATSGTTASLARDAEQIRRLEADLAASNMCSTTELQVRTKTARHGFCVREPSESTLSGLRKYCLRLRKEDACSNSIDVVFVMDCTGSMRPWMDEAKNVVASITDDILSEHCGVVVRLGFVAYRDHCDGDLRLQTQPLGTAPERLSDFIASLRATGGGDGPEDVVGGLSASLELGWDSTTRCLFWVGDAPCHGSQYHAGNMGDDYPQGDPRGLQLEHVVAALAERQGSVSAIEITEHTALMVSCMRDAFQLAAGGGAGSAAAASPPRFQVFPLKGGSHKTSELRRVVSSTVVRAHTATVLNRRPCGVGTSGGQRVFELAPLNWGSLSNNQGWVNVIRYTYNRAKYDPSAT